MTVDPIGGMKVNEWMFPFFLPRDKANWIAEITGSFKDDPDFEEIVRLGKEMRDAELPEED